MFFRTKTLYRFYIDKSINIPQLYNTSTRKKSLQHNLCSNINPCSFRQHKYALGVFSLFYQKAAYYSVSSPANTSIVFKEKTVCQHIRDKAFVIDF